jgi:proline dehydrogenase
MRAALLWASTNPWLASRLPRHAFARRAVTKFMPGETLDDALTAALRLRDAGVPTILTQLGENVADEPAVKGVVDHYSHALDRIAAAGLDTYLSVKPTHLGLDLGHELCERSLKQLTRTAAGHGNLLWLDMEGSAYTEATIRLFRALRAEFDNAGICLQANMRRTANDLAGLLPLAPTVRLVKGAYAEPATVAFDVKSDVDNAYFAHAETLLRSLNGSQRQVLGFATHDVPLVRRIAAAAEALGRSRDSFEVQMLYGIRTREQIQLAKEGFKVRVLISYGEYWFPWYMRRLAERPANVWFVAKSLVAR